MSDKKPSGRTLAAEVLGAEVRNREMALTAKADSLKSQLKDAHLEIKDLHVALGVVESLKATHQKPMVIPRLEKSSGLREACAVILCSDWHAGETVRPEQVMGKNKYNPTVFETRSQRLGAGAEWLLDMNKKAFNVRQAIVWLGGDLMTGHIHEDLAVTNSLGPVEEILAWCDSAEGIIRRMARRVERLRVVCNYGNHGRMTHKPRVQSGAMLSFEVLGYHFLKRKLTDLPNVEVVIATGEHLYVDVFGFTVRFTHGDAIRYQGGVGGIMIPVKKAVLRWNTVQRADLTCMGHFHQYLDMGSIVTNGSLIGYSPFALRIAAEYEEAAQAFFLIDSKRMKCQSTPIWVAEMDAPGHNSTRTLSKGRK